MTATDTITVRPLKDSKFFYRGVSYAKQFGGTFDPVAKVWTIKRGKRLPVTFEDAPGKWYLEIVTDAPVRRHDHNCDGRFGGACECEG